jgi:hypothetical protein
MLDTIKVAIPLTESQYKTLRQAAEKSAKPQWVLYIPITGELHFRRVQGLAELDQNSYHREIRWDIPTEWHRDNCFLTAELSLPKLWYGHNIHLLYDSLSALKLLKKRFEQHFKLYGKRLLPDPASWKVLRADPCYAWNLHGNQQLAQTVLNSLKPHRFPWKKPTIRETSIFFPGASYSMKFYLKLPEFKANDQREMLKAKASLEWVNHLESLAQGVLRVEATLRRRYLRNNQVNTVGDLLQEKWELHHTPDPLPENEFERAMVIHGLTTYWLHQKGVDVQWLIDNPTEVMEKGVPNESLLSEDLALETPPLLFTFGDRKIHYPGGTLTFQKTSWLMKTLQTFITKFLGDNTTMQTGDQVLAILEQTYKSAKAARLTSFWLFIQRFSSERAKEIFGERTYYYNKRELKKAGVSLVEPPKGNVINLDNFRFSIPSQYVVNRVDDFRDSQNLLNLRPGKEA